MASSLEADTIRDLIIDYLQSGKFADSLLVTSTMTREEVASVLKAAFDSPSLMSPGWEMVPEAVGRSGPVDSDDHRAELLDKYLDEAVRFH